jgi:pyridoxamine 5'-phosphate oxidase
MLHAVDESDLADDPIAQLEAWLEDARAAVPQPDAMTLATADADGRPSARIVLLRGLDGRGLTFFTNRDSRKGDDLRANPWAALVFHWWELGRQVRVEGEVEEASEEESTAYWRSRPRESQVAAWASPQSAPLTGRAELESSFADVERRFTGVDVPLPPFWGGYRLRPERVEFWAHRDSRLHDRVRYVRHDGVWRRERLAP